MSEQTARMWSKILFIMLLLTPVAVAAVRWQGAYRAGIAYDYVYALCVIACGIIWMCGRYYAT